MNKLSRRQFLKFTAAAAGGALVACAQLANQSWGEALADAIGTEVYLPVVQNGEPEPASTPEPTVAPPPTGARVVHVHDTDATSWNGSATDYWNYVNQAKVDDMVDQGLLNLTGVASIHGAWQALLPNYQPGQAVAIKLNFNNTKTCNDSDSQIDSIAEPVNAVIRGLKAIGVLEQDIWIYDAMRWIPARFIQKIRYSSVRYFDRGCNELAGFGSSDQNAVVNMSVSLEGPIRITDVLINATYLINMPIMKIHSIAGVSLGFKHHFGTIDHPRWLHDLISIYNSNNIFNQAPIVDIYQNPHIVSKTVLTIGDGIFSAFKTDGSPQLWKTFNNQIPNSLLFSTDPVALDCIMLDLLEAETWVAPKSDSYLQLANAAGLGTYERGDPWGSGYTSLDYLKLEV